MVIWLKWLLWLWLERKNYGRKEKSKGGWANKRMEGRMQGWTIKRKSGKRKARVDDQTKGQRKKAMVDD